VIKSATVIGSLALATLVGGALFLRPRPTAREKLPEASNIPPAARQVLRSKMSRHDLQMRTLFSRVVLLDDDGTARAAGEIFDEPALARPVAGDELNQLLPERFFVLQDDLRTHAKKLVVASQAHDRAAVAEEFAALSKTCVSCHDVYLHDSGSATPSRGER
jgi:hypothetical protein